MKGAYLFCITAYPKAYLQSYDGVYHKLKESYANNLPTISLSACDGGFFLYSCGKALQKVAEKRSKTF